MIWNAIQRGWRPIAAYVQCAFSVERDPFASDELAVHQGDGRDGKAGRVFRPAALFPSRAFTLETTKPAANSTGMMN